MPRETGRQRRRNADSDESSSEDEEQQQTTTTTTTTTVTAPEAPTAPAAVTAPAPAPPARVRAKAPAAAAVSAPSMTLHADPAAAAAAAGEKEEDSGSDDDEEKKEDEEEDEEDEEESVMDEAAAAAAAQMRQLAEEMAAVDYETLTYAALLEILKRASRPQLEETMAQREQLLESAVQQQQNERVERFLDMMGTSSPTAAAAAAAAATAAAAADANGSSADAATAATEGYRYNAMLTRLFEALNRNNEGSAMTERNQLPVPILERMGKKKTVITNFGRICDAFHRPMEDVKDFIEKELSIRGNLDSNSALILKLEIRRQTDFDRVLIKYLDEYVKCNSCHRINTTLTKDGRRLELRCNVCTATRTVTAAGTATFSAQIEKRSRQRAAMTL